MLCFRVCGGCFVVFDFWLNGRTKEKRSNKPFSLLRKNLLCKVMPHTRRKISCDTAWNLGRRESCGPARVIVTCPPSQNPGKMAMRQAAFTVLSVVPAPQINHTPSFIQFVHVTNEQVRSAAVHMNNMRPQRSHPMEQIRLLGVGGIFFQTLHV